MKMEIIFNDDIENGCIVYREYTCIYSYEINKDLIAVYDISVFDLVKDVIDNYKENYCLYTIYKFFVVILDIKNNNEISFLIHVDKSKLVNK